MYPLNEFVQETTFFFYFLDFLAQKRNNNNNKKIIKMINKNFCVIGKIWIWRYMEL